MDEPQPRSRRRQILQGALSLLIVVAIFFFVLPKVADFSEVWAHIKAMSWLEVAVLGSLAVWNLLTYSFVWMAALPGLTFAQAGVASQSSTAVANTIPGGSYLAIGLTYAMFHSWGFRRSIVWLALVVTGLWNNFAKLALPVLALVFLAVQGQASGGRIVVAALGTLVLVVAVAGLAFALHSEAIAARVGNGAARLATPFFRLIRKPAPTGWDIALVRFREKTIGLVRTRWKVLTLATLVSHLSLYLVLLACLRAIGVSEDEVGWAEVLAVFAFTRIVTAIPLTPGGVGVVELALTAGLVAAGGNEEEVVAAVLVDRFLTYVLPIPVGVVCYVVWRRNRRWRKEPVPSPVEPREPVGPLGVPA